MPIFKYYSALPKYTIPTFKDKTIFFAKPTVLNDPFDVSTKSIVEFKHFCDRLPWADYYEDILNNHGIFSMSRSERPDNYHLWCLYASNFDGFVVEFDEEKLSRYIIKWGYYLTKVSYN